jgi:hypothetical protein
MVERRLASSSFFKSSSDGKRFSNWSIEAVLAFQNPWDEGRCADCSLILLLISTNLGSHTMSLKGSFDEVWLIFFHRGLVQAKRKAVERFEIDCSLGRVPLIRLYFQYMVWTMYFKIKVSVSHNMQQRCKY